MSLTKLCFLIGVPFLCIASAQAEVSAIFATEQVQVNATPEQDEIALSFPFEVQGTEPLKIVDFEIGCKCLNASVEKAEYQPGEKGVVNAKFALGSFEGPVTKHITMVSNDSKKPQRILTTLVNVPMLYSFEPKTLTWKMGDPSDPKSWKIKILHHTPINILKISSTRPRFNPQIKVIVPGREYELTLTPPDTTSPTLGVITIETDCNIAKFAKTQCFFNIVRTLPNAPGPIAGAPAPAAESQPKPASK